MAKPLTAEQAIFLLQDALMPMLKAEHRMTKAVLEAVPADKPDYRPDPNAKTAMELVRHIAAAENRFLETTIHGEFSTAPAAFPDSDVPAADGRQGARHLRRKLRQRAGEKGCWVITPISGAFTFRGCCLKFGVLRTIAT